jgi:hypothetical protein
MILLAKVNIEGKNCRIKAGQKYKVHTVYTNGDGEHMMTAFQVDDSSHILHQIEMCLLPFFIEE